MNKNFDKNFEKQVEETILSAILVCDTIEYHHEEKKEDEKTVREIIQGHNLIPTDFQYEHHQHLFKAIMQAWADNISVNTVSISAYKPNAFYRHNDDNYIWRFV